MFGSIFGAVKGATGLGGLGSALGGLSLGQNAVNLAGQVGLGILNYKNQQDNLKYQKNLQQQIFVREDNAVQRRVADLKAAGLSPVLAAGSAAQAGTAVSTVAPRVSEDMAKLSMFENFLSIVKQQNDIATSEAQRSLLNAQTLNTANQMGLNNARSDLDLQILKHNLEIAEKYNIPVGHDLPSGSISIGKGGISFNPLGLWNAGKTIIGDTHYYGSKILNWLNNRNDSIRDKYYNAYYAPQPFDR